MARQFPRDFTDTQISAINRYYKINPPDDVDPTDREATRAARTAMANDPEILKKAMDEYKATQTGYQL